MRVIVRLLSLLNSESVPNIDSRRGEECLLRNAGKF